MAWQRRPLIVLGLIAGLGIGALYYYQSKPVYRSSAQVFVVRKQPEALTSAAGPDVRQPFEDYLSSHLVLIKSPANIRRAVKKPQLQNLKSLAALSDPTNVVINS